MKSKTMKKESVEDIIKQKTEKKIEIIDNDSLEELNRLQMLHLKRNALDNVMNVLVNKADISLNENIDKIIDNYADIAIEENNILKNILMRYLEKDTYKYIITQSIPYRVDWVLNMIIIG